jgi:putative glutamine amidotransferase
MAEFRRPRIAILGRFADSTSVTRYAGVVNARRLLELVWTAGGEPLTFLPVANSNWNERLQGIDGVLMPGGSDINPERYGEKAESEELYGIDDLQDEIDLSLVTYVFEQAMPLLTICRGTQLTNVALGGTLLQHMENPHFHHEAQVTFDANTKELGLSTPSLQASCYHHQALKNLGRGVVAIAQAREGHVEAVRYEEAEGWAFGLQWHPEDNYDSDPAQLQIVKAFVEAARG